MNRSFKFCLFLILIILTACSQPKTEADSAAEKAISIVDTNSADPSSGSDDYGLIKVSSPYDVTETSDRLANIIEEKGLKLFTRIDHSANAAKVGAKLQPTQLLIFGNPKVGTPLMKCAITTAIDLPQKILVTQSDNQQTQVIYNSPEYLKQRHNISGCDEALTKVSGALKGITEAAIK